MALSGLDIYKLLPKTNCGDCGVPTCLAFAMKIASGGASIDVCPHVSEDAKAQLSEAAAPPMKLVTIGIGDKAVSIGDEQVMFRHEKTFFHPPGFALQLSDSMDATQIDKKLDDAKNSQFDRIGQILRGDLIAVKNDSKDETKYLALIDKIKNKIDFPLILMVEDASIAEAALKKIAGEKPLLYTANESNIDNFVNLAKTHEVPLAIKSDNFDKLSELVDKANAAGVKDIILDSGVRSIGKTHENTVVLRRAALVQKVKQFGYPTIVFPNEEAGGDEMLEAVYASVHVSKYAGIIVLSDFESWKILSLATLRQNIYTDPQRPMQVEEGIYPIGNPDKDSPVFVTTNFSLTYFIVTGEVEASNVDSWLCILDSDGLSVLTAWAAGKFVPDRIAPFIKKSGIEDKVSHRKLTIPGYVAQISGELQEELGDWKVEVGVREAGDIPQYLKNWSPN